MLDTQCPKSDTRSDSYLVISVLITLICALCSQTMAQSSSLYKNARPLPDGAVAPLFQKSWTAVAPPQPRRFAKHDLVAIIVREETRYRHDGSAESEKQSDLVAALTEWIQIQNHAIKPAPLSDGPLRANFTFSKSMENDGTVERTDTISGRITAEVIDVKPNGNLIIEARRFIKTDEEEEIMTLTGTCRPEDINVDNTILSSRIHELGVVKTHEGVVHDGLKRGWLTRFFDWANPF